VEINAENNVRNKSDTVESIASGISQMKCPPQVIRNEEMVSATKT
jgi:hypothetical protein